MRQLRRILRLHYEGSSTRDIVRVTGIARTTVQRALERTRAAKLVWPLADEVSDEMLEERFYAGSGKSTGFGAGVRKRQEPDWAELVRELRRPAVTMFILWEEYRKIWPNGYAYSRFCELLRGYQQRLSPVMRQHHVAGDKLFVDYSGKLMRQQVDARITTGTIELFHKGKRVAAHQRRYSGARRHGTLPEHMPPNHRNYAQWSPERFQRWGASIGPETEGLVIAILARRPHPEQGFRTCMGILQLYKPIEKGRAESVSAYALAAGALNSNSVASILSNNLDLAVPAQEEGDGVDTHANVRGPLYFQ
jgi:transposase